MWSRTYWLALLERALKTGAQFAAATLGQDWVGVDLFQANLVRVLGAFAGGALLSALTSIGSEPFGDKDSPSLVVGDKG